jgi:glucose/arabinose dehydrogenase
MPSGIANARSLAEGDKGTIFVGSRLVGNVYAITTDKDGKRTVKTIASGLHRPNGVAFKNGTLYIAELSKISKVEKAEDNLDSPAKLTTIFDKLPKDEAHGWKFIAIGPRQQALCPGRASPATTCCMTRARPDPPHQSRRQRR